VDPIETESTEPGIDSPGQSAIILRVPVPPPIERLRRAHDPSASVGIGAHVTVLYPFLHVSRLDAAVRNRLAGIVAREPAFDVTFASTHRFPGVVWLDPVPAQPFRRLTRAIWGAFPDHPPYGGAFRRVVPHLTVAQVDDADVMATIEARLLPWLPVAAPARRVDVMSTGPDGRWHIRWRLPLGAHAGGR
jgi:2'-5' RNA ligase